VANGVTVLVGSRNFARGEAAANGYSGRQSVEEGSREVVCVAPLGGDGPTGTFTRWENSTIPW
jgi:hypothetical protein